MKNPKKANKKIKKISLKPQLYESWNYIKESKAYIYSVIIIFAISLFYGAIFHDQLNFLSEYITNIIKLTENLSGIKLIAFILNNNIISSFFGLFFGILFGFFSIFNTLFNGIMIGFVLEKVSSTSGILQIWRLFPHGIFELPAIFVSLGLGLKLGTFVFKKDKIKTLKEYLRLSWITFLLIVIPLLVIAAIIEGLLITLMK